MQSFEPRMARFFVCAKLDISPILSWGVTSALDVGAMIAALSFEAAAALVFAVGAAVWVGVVSMLIFRVVWRRNLVSRWVICHCLSRCGSVRRSIIQWVGASFIWIRQAWSHQCLRTCVRNVCPHWRRIRRLKVSQLFRAKCPRGREEIHMLDGHLARACCFVWFCSFVLFGSCPERERTGRWHCSLFLGVLKEFFSVFECLEAFCKDMLVWCIHMYSLWHDCYFWLKCE